MVLFRIFSEPVWFTVLMLVHCDVPQSISHEEVL